MLTLSLKVYAQDSLHITFVGRLEINWDSVRDVAVRDSYAYLATCNTGLRIVDISHPANPIETGFYDTPGEAREVMVTENHAFVADNDPKNPVHHWEV